MERSHWLVDWWVDDPQLVEHHSPMRAAILAAAGAVHLNLLGERFHDFEPKGFTGFLLLRESHIAVHSWWEEGLLTLDVFTCRPDGAEAFVRTLRERITPRREEIRRLERGVCDSPVPDGRPGPAPGL